MSRLKLYVPAETSGEASPPAPRAKKAATPAVTPTATPAATTPNRLPASVRWPGRRPGSISFVKAAAELRPGYLETAAGGFRSAGPAAAKCPDCGGRDVTALGLTDGTVVGHQCDACDRQWPVMPRAEGCG